MEAAAIVQLIMLITDLLVIAPIQYAKLKKAVSNGSLTSQQVDALILASEKSSDDLIAAVDDL